MQREVVVAPEHWTVGEAIDHLRDADALPDQFYHVILIDPAGNPWLCHLGRVLSARRDVALRDIVEDSFRSSWRPRLRAMWPTCSISIT